MKSRFDWRNLVLLLAVFVLCVGGMEMALRWTGFPPQYFLLQSLDSKPVSREVKEVRRAPEGSWNGGLYVGTPSGKRLRANVDGVIRHHFLSKRDIPIRTNALGFRGPDIETNSGFSGKTILFLGDSITLGDYLPEEQTFVARVGALSAGRWRTVNAGVGSIGVENELAILKERGRYVNADWVVLDLYLNDVEPSPTVELFPLPDFLSPSWVAQFGFQFASVLRHHLSEAPSSIAPEVWHAWDQAIAKRMASSQDTGEAQSFFKSVRDNLRDWGSAWSPGARERILDVVNEMQAEVAKQGARFSVAIFPARPQVEAKQLFDEPQRAFRHRLEERGVAVLDLLSPLREAFHEQEQKALFYDQCHHTPLGSELVAQALTRFLDSQPL